MLLQNAVAVLSIGLLILMNALRVERIDGRQAAFYVWDALVLVLQCWANFAALQHLPVAAITVIRALAIPLVAWCELIMLDTRLSAAHHACIWLVICGAALYAHDDLASDGRHTSLVGYFWACVNLLTYTANSLLDRLMMTSSNQTATGLSLFTQGFSLPVTVAQGYMLHGLTLRSTLHMVQSLDWQSVAALLVTGVGAGILGNAYAQCYKRASATAVTVAGNVNKALSVVVSFFVFGTEVSQKQAAGILCCLGGAFGYSLLGAWRRDAKTVKSA